MLTLHAHLCPVEEAFKNDFRAAGPHEPWQGQSGDSERRPVHAQLVCGALRRRADCA